MMCGLETVALINRQEAELKMLSDQNGKDQRRVEMSDGHLGSNGLETTSKDKAELFGHVWRKDVWMELPGRSERGGAQTEETDGCTVGRRAGWWTFGGS